MRRLLVLAFVLAILGIPGAAPAFSATPGAANLLPAADRWSAGCIWFPENILGTMWTFYCPQQNEDGETESGRVAGSDVLAVDGEGSQSSGPQRRLMAWIDESGVTGAALASAMLPVPWEQNDDSTGSIDRQHRSFWASGSENAVNPCGMLTGAVDGVTAKNNVTCVNVRQDLTRDPPRNPCLRIPVVNGEIRRACTESHAAWAERAPLAPGDVPACELQTSNSACPDTGGVITSDAFESEDEDFIDAPITWIREQSKLAIRSTLRWWIMAPDPIVSDDHTDCDTNSPPYTDRREPYPCSRNTVDFIVVVTNPVTYTVIVIVFIVGGVRLADRRDPKPIKEIFRGGFILLFVTGTSVYIVVVLVRACQEISDVVAIRGLNPDEGTYANADQALERAADRYVQSLDHMDSFVIFMIAAVMLLGFNFAQYAYMTARLFFVIVLTGTLPLSASGTSTAAGRDIFRRNISYLLAFILIKPATIIVFVAGSRLWAPPGNFELDTAAQFRGLFVLALVTVVGPATVRVIFTLTAPAAGSSTATLGATAAILTSGARVATAPLNLVRHRR